MYYINIKYSNKYVINYVSNGDKYIKYWLKQVLNLY